MSELERDALPTLVRELYDLSASNKHFIHARIAPSQESLAQYKNIVAQCMCPDGWRDPVQIAKAKKAISEYRRAARDVIGEIDLMIHFVECGNKFTLEYGDIDGDFYDSLLGMYARAADAVARLRDVDREPFRRRLRELTESSEGIGWGYHDGLCDTYYSVFANADA